MAAKIHIFAICRNPEGVKYAKYRIYVFSDSPHPDVFPIAHFRFLYPTRTAIVVNYHKKKGAEAPFLPCAGTN